MAFTETLADFIGADTPGYVSATVGGVAVDALFDNAFTLAGLGIEGVDALLHVKTADVTSTAHGTAVIVNAVNYRVAGIEPDGFGVTVLRLERV